MKPIQPIIVAMNNLESSIQQPSDIYPAAIVFDRRKSPNAHR